VKNSSKNLQQYAEFTKSAGRVKLSYWIATLNIRVRGRVKPSAVNVIGTTATICGAATIVPLHHNTQHTLLSLKPFFPAV